MQTTHLGMGVIPETVVPVEVSINQDDDDGNLLDIYYTPNTPGNAILSGLFWIPLFIEAEKEGYRKVGWIKMSHCELLWINALSVTTNECYNEIHWGKLQLYCTTRLT